jgi:electron transport complex protein RnfB
MASLATRILDALPQTQCARCGYPDCEAYATAIAADEAQINQCPPGGAEGIARLAVITGRAILPLNPDNGAEAPRSLAVIDENWCIGCTLCIKACPTDAIMGSNKLMHTVIEPYCTGCALCLPVCPVDCISLENDSGDATGWDAWSQTHALQARIRYAALRARRAKESASAGQSTLLPAAQATVPSRLTPAPPKSDFASAPSVPSKQAILAAARARAKALRQR